ncbi:MAG TPA: NAD-dependent succinate-semialdehyde dehydrogenase [Cytophagaceae bacterium]
MIRSINPFTLRTNAEFEPYTEDAINAILESSQAAFLKWKNSTIESRKKLLHNLADLLLKKKDDLASLIVSEMGKPIREALLEIEKCALVCRYYADEALRFLQDEYVTTDSTKSLVVYQPLGVVLAVMPWNFPFWQLFRCAAPSVAAGNTIILKHASNVPLCALAMEKLFNEAGFPKGVFHTVLINPEKIEQLISHPAVQAVSVTGSEVAGSNVASLAGKYIKRSVLELGGSDPFLVLADANVEETALAAAKSRLVNGGQSCIAAKRFIVNESVVDEFVEKLKDIFQSMRLGDPMEMTTDIGPLARRDLLENLSSQVERSVAMGTEIITGGFITGPHQNFFKPAIITNVGKGMPAYHEELFGPVAIIIKVSNDDEAISIANDTKFGLGASVWTKDIAKGEAIARRIEAGQVFVNKIVSSDTRLPFGGIKTSGYGRELSSQGIREFVNVKALVVG